MPRTYRDIRETQAGRAIAIAFVCALLFSSKWVELSHVHEDCHEHACLACGVSTEAGALQVEMDAPVPQLLGRGALGISLSCPLARSQQLQQIRAPPTA